MPEDTKESTDSSNSIENLKAEMDRKLNNLQSSIAQSLQQLPLIVQEQIVASMPKAPAAKTEPEEPLDVLSDPNGFMQKMIEKVSDVVDKKVDNRITTYENNSIQRSQLYSQFPELNDQENPLTQEVIKRYSGLSKEQKMNGDAYLQSIVYQVAAEKGVRPASFRQNDQDDFTLSGMTSKGDGKVSKKKKDDIDPISKDWMEVLKKVGAPVDLDNEQDREKLKQYSERRNWSNYGGSPDFKRGAKKGSK